jgi:hypothetical protein
MDEEFSDFDESVIGDVNIDAAEKFAADIGDPRLKVCEIMLKIMMALSRPSKNSTSPSTACHGDTILPQPSLC